MSEFIKKVGTGGLNVIEQARVTLIGQMQFTCPPHIDWETDTAVGGEALAEFAGRLCYLSFGKEAGIDGHKSINGRVGNEIYLQNIKTQKHGSVLEHAVFSFLIEGVSRSLTHELVRHRAGMSYSQLSQRYVDESEVAFVVPPEVEFGFQSGYTWLNACEHALTSYNYLLQDIELEHELDINLTNDKKRARQTARSVLPNSTETKIVVTGNARAWRHFLVMRGSAGADTEIRNLAIKIYNTLYNISPNLFGDFGIVSWQLSEQEGDEISVLTTRYPNV